MYVHAKVLRSENVQVFLAADENLKLDLRYNNVKLQGRLNLISVGG